MADRRDNTKVEQEEQMNSLFSNVDPAARRLLGVGNQPVASFGNVELKDKVEPKTFKGKAAEDWKKQIKEKKANSYPYADPANLYELKRNRWVNDPNNLTLEDEIKLVYATDRFKNIVYNLYDSAYIEDAETDEDKARASSVYGARKYYKNNFEAIESFDKDEEIEKLREKYADHEDIKNFNKYIRKNNIGAGVGFFGDLENLKDSIWLSDDKISENGQTQWDLFVKNHNRDKQRTADNIQDVPRLAIRSAATAARDIGSIPDGIGYILGAAGNTAIGVGGELIGIDYDDAISGYHESFIGKGLDFVGDIAGRAFLPFELIETGGEAVLNAEFMQYDGYLKENERTAKNLEFAGSIAATLPLEILAITGYVNKLSNPKIISSIKKATQAEDINPLTKAQQLMNTASIKMGDRINFAGAKRILAQEKRAAYFANVAIVATHLGVDWAEHKFDLENNAWWNGAKIPLYFGLAFGAARYGPGGVDKVLNQFGLAERTGPPTVMNQIKFWAKNIGKGNLKTDLDTYLIKANNLNPDSVARMSRREKLGAAQMTRKEYESMEDLGIAFRDIKEFDAVNAAKGEPTYYFDDLVRGIEDTMTARNNLLEIYAKTFKMKDGTDEFYDNIDDFTRDYPELASEVDIGIEDMLHSESLRAAANALQQGKKLPMLGKFSAKTIYNDLRTASKNEVKRRQAFANVLKRILPDVADTSVIDPAKLRFINDLKKMNVKRLGEAEDKYLNATKKLAEEKVRIMAEYKSGINIFEGDFELLGNRLDADDIIKLNARNKLFEKVGWTPRAATEKILEKAGILTERVSPVSWVKKDRPERAFGKKSRQLFNNAFESSAKKIDDMYDRARESNRDKYININEADDTFQKIKSDLQYNGRNYGTNPNEYSNFGSWYYHMGTKWIDRAVKMESQNQLDTILKSYIKGQNKGADEAKILDLMDEYKAKPRFDRIDKDGNVFKQSINEVSDGEYGGHLKGLLNVSRKEGNNFLAIGIDLNELQSIRSNIMARARGAYRTPLGHQLSDLAEDLRIALEVGSKKFMDDADYTAFITANKRYAEDFVPLFKQGAGEQIASKSKNLEYKVDDADIMTTFLTKEDGVEQFRKIFKDNPEADDLMKQAIGRHIDNGKALDEDQLLALLENGIIDMETYKMVSPVNLSQNDEFAKIAVESAEKRIQEHLKRQKEVRTAGMLNEIGNVKGNQKTNADSIYKTFTEDYTSSDLKNLLKNVNSNNYKGGKEALKKDIVTILTKPILNRVTVLGDELARETSLLLANADRRGLSWSKRTAKNMKKRFNNLTEGALNKQEDLIARAEWGAEVDSRAFQQTLEEIGPQLKVLSPDLHKKLDVIANSAIRFGAATAEQGKALGTVRSMSVESILSRVYSIQRGVVSKKYVLSEMTLQRFRENRMRLLRDLLNNENTPELILQVIYDNGLASSSIKLRWSNFIRGWAGFTGEEMSDEEITETTKGFLKFSKNNKSQ